MPFLPKPAQNCHRLNTGILLATFPLAMATMHGVEITTDTLCADRIMDAIDHKGCLPESRLIRWLHLSPFFAIPTVDVLADAGMLRVTGPDPTGCETHSERIVHRLNCACADVTRMVTRKK